jgi:hypothetical protein
MKFIPNQLSYRDSLILFLLFIQFSCQTGEEVKDQENSSIISDIIPPIEDILIIPELDSIENTIDNFSFETTFIENQGWGYEIYNNDKLYIKQPHIPAIQGVKGFGSAEKAARTAEFAIYKIENGFLPPTLSKQELDSLAVLD